MKAGKPTPPSIVSRVATPTPPKAPAPKNRPQKAGVKGAPSPDVRFRLVARQGNIVDKKFVFNAPRAATLKNVVPFLKKWLVTNGFGDGTVSTLYV
jgi:hypothetical protein